MKGTHILHSFNENTDGVSLTQSLRCVFLQNCFDFQHTPLYILFCYRRSFQLKCQGETIHLDILEQKARVNNTNFENVLPPFSLLRDFSFQNTSEHFAVRFRQSYLIWEASDVTAIELSSKE